MTYAKPEERKSLIVGLRCFADFLERNPEVPSPRRADVLVFPPATSDKEALEEIDTIASLVGAQIEDCTASHGHYTASRYFGPVQYRAVAILTNRRHDP